MVLEFIVIISAIIFFIFIEQKYFKSIKISLLIIFMFLVFPIIYICFLKIFYFYIPGKTIGNISDWINFSGGCIGAVITILGIWIQLKNDTKKRKIEENIRIKEKEKGAVEFFIIYFKEIDNNIKNINSFFKTAIKHGHNFSEYHFLKSLIPNEIYWTMYEKLADTNLGPKLITAILKVQNMDTIITIILKNSSISSNDNIFKAERKFEFLKDYKKKSDIIDYIKFVKNNAQNFHNNNDYNSIYIHYSNLEILLQDSENSDDNKITSLENMEKYINNLRTYLDSELKKYT